MTEFETNLISSKIKKRPYKSICSSLHNRQSNTSYKKKRRITKYRRLCHNNNKKKSISSYDMPSPIMQLKPFMISASSNDTVLYVVDDKNVNINGKNKRIVINNGLPTLIVSLTDIPTSFNYKNVMLKFRIISLQKFKRIMMEPSIENVVMKIDNISNHMSHFENRRDNIITTNIKDLQISCITKLNSLLFSWDNIIFNKLVSLRCFYTTLLCINESKTINRAFQNIEYLDIKFAYPRRKQSLDILNGLNNVKSLTIRDKMWTYKDHIISMKGLTTLNLIYNDVKQIKLRSLGLMSVTLKDCCISKNSIEIDGCVKNMSLVKCKYTEPKINERVIDETVKSIVDRYLCKKIDTCHYNIGKIYKSIITKTLESYNIIDVFTRKTITNNIDMKNMSMRYGNHSISPEDMKKKFIKNERTMNLIMMEHTMSIDDINKKILTTLNIPTLEQ